MPLTARFHIKRQQVLEKLFNEFGLKNTWRKVVRSQMRRLDILDLHDYYDFNISIEEIVKNIRNTILNGKYRASKPLIYKIEKKFGIGRHLMIPSPSDALIFQTITNFIARDLKQKQPSTNAYFSRDRHFKKLPHEFSESVYDNWIELWKRFQREIYKFTQECKYLVVTDIANYFDNIGLRELRHVISGCFGIEEVILDILFKIIEELSWVPDYLPNSLNGLPTINIEAPRLLAHILLFEIDEILIEETNNSFVRWMDDINFGVESENDARKILSDINDVLKSRGLALNLSKTKIYTAKQAEEHFLFYENKYLDDVSNTIEENDYNKGQLSNDLEKHFKKHLKNDHLRNWGKVTKRYYTMAGKIKTTRLLKYSETIFSDRPGVRSNVKFYLNNLGYKKYTAEIIFKLIQNVQRYDDITLFMLIKLITDWKIPLNASDLEFIKKVENILTQLFISSKSIFIYYCYLWFSAKYADPESLFLNIMKNRNFWANDEFLSRQVTAILPRIYPHKPVHISNLLNDLINKGPGDVKSVGVNIRNLINLEKSFKGMYFYLFPKNKQKIYPLPKYLILYTVLNSENFNTNRDFKKRINDYIDDPWYKYWIDKYFM